MILLILSLLFSGTEEKGWLIVETEPSGLEIYIDGNPMGKSPLKDVGVSVGKHTVSLFSSDTIEDAYFKARSQGAIKGILSLPELSKYDAGTVEVNIESEQKIKVFLSYKEAMGAPTKTRCLLYGCLGGIFTSGLITGVVISLLF